MLVVAVIIYNRYMNLLRWIDCWNQCYPANARLVIIHNDNGLSKQFRKMCEANNITYVRRENIGYDIGAMQDVFEERLKGFPNEWKYLLWCTDDVIPMQKDFTVPFINTLNKTMVGVAAMQISPEYKAHVRTGCFCISKSLSKCIKFPADPVTTKKQCYEFEHKGNTLTDQVRAIGLSCEQVSSLMTSPMYDTNYWLRNTSAIKKYSVYNREEEHRKVFKKILQYG